jgi:hypothetical protein
MAIISIVLFKIEISSGSLHCDKKGCKNKMISQSLMNHYFRF